MERLDDQMIDAMRHSLAERIYPGYPSERLHLELDDMPDDLTLPEGAWSTRAGTLPTAEQQEVLRAQGIELDSLGRPMHPWLLRMITDPDIGVLTGRGRYWHWGPNEAADAVFLTDEETPQILLILRSDSHIWALPGGHRDPGEDIIDTAKREGFEETGVLVIGDDGETIYSGVIGDLRSTAHAWAHTTAVLWKLKSTLPVYAGDDALDAKWFPVDQLPENRSRQHDVIIKQAVARHALIDTVAYAVSFPPERKEFTRTDGGHMAYQRFVIRHRDGSEIFLKSHDETLFSDEKRASNSRLYLVKEKFIYDHLEPHVRELLPASVNLVDDHSLMMEALTPELGWHWRAPQTNTEQYIDELISSLSLLQRAPIPDDRHIAIEPSYDSHIIEGWHTIEQDDSVEEIQDIIEYWKPKLRDGFKELADQLSRDLSELAQDFTQIDDPDKFYFTHHDLRQTNVAWHPALGTKIIDWSWAGHGRKNSDITTLMIDLNKSGHDVGRYMELFNADHALTMIGFWLNHSLWPTRTADQSVRFHQVASAVSAYDLLMKDRQRRLNPVPTETK